MTALSSFLKGKVFAVLVVVAIIATALAIAVGVRLTAGRQPSPHISTGSTSPDNQNDRHDPAQRQNSITARDNTENTPTNAACKLLTLSTARQTLSPSAHLDPAGTTGSKTADIETSICTYMSDARATVTITVRAALTPLGVSENALAFGSGKPRGTTVVPGYGQAAYWDPTKSALNILNNNNWLILERVDGSPPRASGLDDVQLVAQAIRPEL